jgi:hypothetical protein
MSQPADEAEELERAFALKPEEEAKLQKEILLGGWELGCFLTDEQAGKPLVDEVAWLDRMEQRPRHRRATGSSDPHPKGLPRSDPPADTGWMILVNRCDLLSDLSREPLIELVRCEKAETQKLGEAGKNSPRFVLAYRPEGAKFGWVIDLRHRAVVPKTRLPQFGEPAQILPHDQVERGRFAMRAGRRYSRVPLPEMFVPLQESLRDLIEKDYAEETTEFHEWIICEETDRSMPVLVALISEDIDLVEAEDLFEKILTDLSSNVEEVVDIDGSRVERMSAIRLEQFLGSYPVDTLEVTHAAEQKIAKAKRARKPAPGPTPKRPIT